MAAFLGRPSNETVQRLVRPMNLIAGPSAPTAINPEMSAKLAKSKSLLSLSAESRAITKRLQKRCGFAKYSPDNDPDSQRKQDVDAALHRLKNNKRNQILEKLPLNYGARILGSAALIFEAQQGKLKIIELLLARGADVNKVEFVLLRLIIMYEKLD
ncbi:hypothetical protein MMC18_001800 [Xylographa bjoerkii]|nr:hypothetical protein [Xylographa bjoerkii]